MEINWPAGPRLTATDHVRPHGRWVVDRERNSNMLSWKQISFPVDLYVNVYSEPQVGGWHGTS